MKLQAVLHSERDTWDVCMVYTYLHIYIHMSMASTCTCIHIYLVYVHSWKYMYTSMQACMHAWVYMYGPTYRDVCICIYLSVLIYIYVYVDTYSIHMSKRMHSCMPPIIHAPSHPSIHPSTHPSIHPSTRVHTQTHMIETIKTEWAASTLARTHAGELGEDIHWLINPYIGFYRVYRV